MQFSCYGSYSHVPFSNIGGGVELLLDSSPHVRSLESSDAQASFYAGQELLTEKILSPKEQFARINAVSLKDIQKTAQDIFRPEKLNLALIGPFKNKKRFDKLLKL